MMDGNSTDRTREIAREQSTHSRSGSRKGRAVRKAVSLIEQLIVLIIDSGVTYWLDQADWALKPILEKKLTTSSATVSPL